MKKLTLLLFVVWSACIFCACQKKSMLNTPSAKPKISGKVKTRLLQKAAKPTPTPDIGSTVLVHYNAWLAQPDGSPGKLVDSSVQRGEPLQFTVGLKHVIKGFEEGVMKMQVGEKRRLFIPSELAYGKQGVGLLIPPNSKLVFEVELLAMK